MDRLAANIMARAEGVDRGVVNMNFEQKDSIAASSALVDIQVDADNGGTGAGGPASNDGNGVGSGDPTSLVDNAPTTNVAAPIPTNTNANAESSASSIPGDGGMGSSGVSSNTAVNTAAAETSQAKSGGGGGGGGGIGTGAIVGIVVGVVGGLLLIAAVAFFLLRKRRQKKNADGYDGADPANTYMVDKETQGRATDSPNSPYSDENQTQHVPLEDVTRDEPPLVGIPRTSTSGSQGHGRTSGAQTPQGVSSNVAHLVEEGMTLEEIRRLEEEERQLDDEIERAARR